jgi:hypothetical protein
MLYKNGKRNVAGFTIVFTLLSASIYFANFFLDEFATYLTMEYGQQAYYNLVGYIEILTAVDSLPAAMYMLMLLSIVISFIFTLQYTILVAVCDAKPLVLSEYRLDVSSISFKTAVCSYDVSVRPTTIAHLRI